MKKILKKFNILKKIYEKNLRILFSKNNKKAMVRGHMWLLIVWLDLFTFHKSIQLYFLTIVIKIT